MTVKYFILPVIVSLLVLSGCQGSEAEPVTTLTGLDKVAVGEGAARELAIARCRDLYNQNFSLGTDFSSGVCLAPQVVTDWACSVEPASESAAELNPCAAYQSGEVDHIVILDDTGQLIIAE
jgi:hypothetical protein